MSEQNINNDNESNKTHVIPTASFNPLQQIFERFMAQHNKFGFQTSDADLVFHPLPFMPEEDDTFLLKQPWRLMLELYTNEDERMILGIDLYGDIVLGRGESRPGRIILDLDPYGAQHMGVSREHAMLRPTATKLYVIDQGSTNGTTINGSISGRGVASSVKDDDIVNLAKMMVMIKVVKEPNIVE